VEGPAGIGKTRLVAEARRRAEHEGVVALSARGSEMERDYPFGVVRQLFEAILMDAAAADRLLAGSAGAARPVLAPLDEMSVPIGDVSFAVLHGLYWLTVNATGGGPLLLAIDDLHWCDRPSLRFLAYLVRRLEGLPLMVVASLRPAEPGADAALLAEVARDPLVTTLRPAPLSGDGALLLVRSRLGADPDASFAAACHRATGGNPLLLNELLAEMEVEHVSPEAGDVTAVHDLGPRAVSRAVNARLSRLPAETIAVAGAAAVLGDGAELARVAELAEVGERVAADAIGELARIEVLRSELPVGFVHPLVRAAVYYDLSPGDRERGHARAARLLAEAGASPESVAAHLIETEPRGDAAVADLLGRAAAVAMSRGAGEGAIAYLRRALAEPPAADRRPEMLAHLGMAESLGNGPASIAHLQAAYAETPDPVGRARIATVLGRILMFADRIEEGVALAGEAAEALPEDQHDLRQRLDATRLGAANWDFTKMPFDDPELHRYRGALVEDTVGARMLAGVAAYQWLMADAGHAECAALGARAVSDGILVEVDNVGVPFCGGLIALVLADDDEAVRVSDQSLARAYRSGSVFEAGGAQLFRGFAHLRRGDLGEAWRMLEGAVGRVLEWGEGDVLPIVAAHEGDAQTERGDLEGARRTHASVAPYAAAQSPGTNAAWWLASRMRLLIALGDAEGALAVSEECERRFAGTVTNPAVVPWRSLRAEALHRLGRTAEAVATAEAELPLARRWGAPGTVGRSLRVLGTVAGDLGRLEEAVAVLEGSPARLELAKALAAQGTVLRLSRRPIEAREPLRRALELASACEAGGLVEHIRSEVYATGARPRTDALTGMGALTTSERRVADLAAEGSSNKDIAQALYVTPKTVEVHLSSAYRKLGIRSRRELAGALAG
jgi:DNA-binding CsgD family transcriptional regulator